MTRYYFDHNATTPLAPEVLDAMLPALTDVYGNAASLHHFGQIARQRLDQARREVASFLGAKSAEIVFTSGGTESDQMAILGQQHVITTTVEHPAVLNAARQNDHATFVPVDSRGLVDPDDIRKALHRGVSPGVSLISVMHANNELGTVQPVEEISALAREAGIPFHSDGVQAAGKIPVNLRELGVDLYSIAAHKIYGPKGVGVLFAKDRRRRAGTDNVAGALGLAAALQWEARHGLDEAARVGVLRDRLEQSVLDRIRGVHVNGAGAPRVPNTSNLRFDGIDSEPLLIALDLRGFAVSSGSACSSGAAEPSHVLQAIGLTKEQARSSLRISLGRSNDADQVDALADAMVECVAHLRRIAPGKPVPAYA
jgi:cysteine desulfurase